MYINSMGEHIYYKCYHFNNFLNIALAGTTYPNLSYKIFHNITKNSIYDYYVFEYVESGKGYIETPYQKYTVKSGDTYFLNKLKYHVYYPDKNDLYTKTFVVLSGTYVDTLVRVYNIDKSVIIVQKESKEILNEIIKAVEDKEVDEIDYDYISQQVLKLFQLIKNDNLVFESVASDYSSIIMSYLNANITEKISLDKMSNDLHISKSHIERLFKEKYNTTPMKYFMNMKISYAANLLSATNQSVSFIARTVGIDDPKYLSKCIKKKYGFSPSKYRKQKNVTI